MTDHDQERVGGPAVLRWVRRVLLVVGWLVGGLIGLVLVLLLALQIDAVSTFAARTVAGMVTSDSLHVEVGEVSGTWVGSLRVTDLEAWATSGGDTSWRVALDTATARYDLLPLLDQRLEISDARATGLSARVRLEPQGAEQPPDTAPSPWIVDLGRLEVLAREVAIVPVDTGQAAPQEEPWVLADGRLVGRDIHLGEEVRAVLDTLHASFRPPERPEGWGRLAASGALEEERIRIGALLLRSPESDVRAEGMVPITLAGTAPEGLDLDVDLSPLHMADLGPFLPEGLPDSLHLRGGASLRTESDTLLVHAELEADVPGRLELDGRIAGPRSAPDVAGTARVTALDLRAWGLASRPLVLDADVEGDVDALTRERMHGSITADARVDEQGAGRLGTARLTANADSAGARWIATWEAEGFGLDAAGGLSVALAQTPEWSVEGDLFYSGAGVAVPGAAVPGTAEPAGPEEAPPLEILAAAGRLDAEGEGFVLDSLVAEATVRLDSLRMRSRPDAPTDALVGPGTLTANLREGEFAASLELDAAGGDVALEAEGNLPARTAGMVRGRLEDVDVAALLGDTVASTVTAELSGAVRSVEPLDASATVRLPVARYGAWRVDSARVVAEAREDAVDLRLAMALPDSATVTARASALLGGEGGLESIAVDTLTWEGLDIRALAAAPDTSAIPSSDLSGRGEGRVQRVTAGWAGSLSLELTGSRLGDADIDAGTITAQLDPDEASAEFTIETRGGFLEGGARTTLGDAPRVVELPTLRFADIDLGSLSGGVAPPTRLTGTASAELRGADLEGATGSARFFLEPSMIDSMALDTAAVRAQLDSGRVEADARIAALGGVLGLAGQGRVGAHPYTYELEGWVDRPADASDRGTALFARFGVDGTGTALDSADAQAWVQVDSGSVSGAPMETGVLRVALSDGVVRLDTLRVALPGAELVGEGRLPVAEADTTGRMVLTATVSRADLVASLGGPELTALGEGSLEAVAEGSLPDLRLRADARLSALLMNDIRVQGAELQATARRDEEAGWTRGEAHLRVDRMRLPTAPVQSLEVDAALTPEDEVVVEASAVIDGNRDVQLAARVEEVGAPSALLLERLAFRADEDRWNLARPARIRFGEEIGVDSLLLSVDGQRIFVDGALPDEGPLDVEAVVEGFDIATVADLLGFPSLRGVIDASLDLTGTADAPLLQARIGGEFRPSGAAPGDLDLDLDYRDGTADVSASVVLATGPSVTADLALPYRLDLASDAPGLLESEPMTGSVMADQFPVAWLQPFVPAGVAEEITGVLEADVQIGGTPEDPALDGLLALRDGGARIPALEVRYRDAGMLLAFQGTDLVIDSARVRSDEGTLSAAGTVGLADLGSPAYDLSVTADQFQVMRTAAVHATVSGNIEIQGEGLAPSITGDAVVERADFYLGDLIGGPAVETVELTEDQWEEIARVFAYRPPSEREDQAPLMDSLAMDLDVTLSRATWVRKRSNPEIALQITGEVELMKERGDSLQLLGSVEVVSERSWIDQFGRRFDIAEGTLTFRGDPTNTLVQLRAEYDVPSRNNPGSPEVSLAIMVSGTPEDLSLELSSTPELAASDMVSYLVLGRPARQALEGAGAGGGDGSVAESGGALALDRLSGAVETYAREEIGLDVVEITTSGLEGMTLIAGRYLSPELYLGIRQPINRQQSVENRTQGAPSPEIEMELQAVRWLLLNLRAGGQTGVEVYVRSRIAYD